MTCDQSSTRHCSTTTSQPGARLSVPDGLGAPAGRSLYELGRDSASLSLYAGDVLTDSLDPIDVKNVLKTFFRVLNVFKNFFTFFM